MENPLKAFDDKYRGIGITPEDLENEEEGGGEYRSKTERNGRPIGPNRSDVNRKKRPKPPRIL